MKRIFISIAIMIASFASLIAQDVVKGSVIASSREDLLTKLPSEVAYFMPEFTHAYIFYTNGTKFEANLNICLVDNSVRYINDKCDTLLMANAASVNKILAGDAIYQQLNGTFVHQLAAYGQTSLSEKKIFNFKEPEINIGFANLAPTSTARAYNAEDHDVAKGYGKDMEIDYRLETVYVLTHKNKTYSCKQSSFIKFFPEKKQQIKEFVKKNDIDFSNKDHVISLFLMCTEK